MIRIEAEFCDLVFDRWLQWKSRRHRVVEPMELAVEPCRSLERPQRDFQANKGWFRAHRDALLSEHPEGGYVAVWRKHPVLFGETRGEVADEFYAMFGAEPVYIGKLSGEADIEELSSPQA